MLRDGLPPPAGEANPPVPPVGRGVLLLVVGPSGAGKDTLIRTVRGAFAAAGDVLFVRRAITRPDDPDGEGHLSMTQAEFERAARRGQFALRWRAHGLSYGIPAGVDDHVASGGVAVANGSRAALPLFAARYLDLRVVHVTARPEVLAARLAARGRESRQAILARMARAGRPALAEMPDGTVIIDNSGRIETAATRLAEEIRKALETVASRPAAPG